MKERERKKLERESTGRREENKKIEIERGNSGRVRLRERGRKGRSGDESKEQIER